MHPLIHNCSISSLSRLASPKAKVSSQYTQVSSWLGWVASLSPSCLRNKSTTMSPVQSCWFERICCMMGLDWWIAGSLLKLGLKYCRKWGTLIFVSALMKLNSMQLLQCHMNSDQWHCNLMDATTYFLVSFVSTSSITTTTWLKRQSRPHTQVLWTELGKERVMLTFPQQEERTLTLTRIPCQYKQVTLLGVIHQLTKMRKSNHHCQSVSHRSNTTPPVLLLVGNSSSYLPRRPERITCLGHVLVAEATARTLAGVAVSKVSLKPHRKARENCIQAVWLWLVHKREDRWSNVILGRKIDNSCTKTEILKFDRVQHFFVRYTSWCQLIWMNGRGVTTAAKKNVVMS